MKMKSINSTQSPKPMGGYSQAIEVSGTTRRLYVSGQIPETRDKVVPSSFEAQARLVWVNILAQLHTADMALENLVKVTIFLSSREYGLENRKIRQEVMGDHPIASTVIITGILDENWLLEIEAIAEA